jgi:DNA/RNA-binding domain of Phe-tRNA-synthetase-like protein
VARCRDARPELAGAITDALTEWSFSTHLWTALTADALVRSWRREFSRFTADYVLRAPASSNQHDAVQLRIRKGGGD